MTYNEIIAMVLDSIFASIVLAFLSMIVAYFYKKYKNEKLLKPIRTITFLIYIYMLLFVTVFRGGLYQNLVHSINLVPFDELLTSSYYQLEVLGTTEAVLMFSYNVLGNIIWFIPLGILLSTLFEKMNVWKTLMISFIVSLSIEILQYLFYTGVSDIDDLIFNIVGGICGYYIYQFGKKRIEKGQNYDHN